MYKLIKLLTLAVLFYVSNTKAGPLESKIPLDFINLEHQLKEHEAALKENSWNKETIYPTLNLKTYSPIPFDTTFLKNFMRNSINLKDPDVLRTIREFGYLLPFNVPQTLNSQQYRMNSESVSQILNERLDNFEFKIESSLNLNCKFTFKELQEFAKKIIFEETILNNSADVDCAIKATKALFKLLDPFDSEVSLSNLIHLRVKENPDKLLSSTEIENLISLSKKAQEKIFSQSDDSKFWNEAVKPSKEKLVSGAQKFYQLLGFNTNSILAGDQINPLINMNGVAQIIKWPTDIRWAMNWNLLLSPTLWGSVVHEMGHVIHAQEIKQERIIYQKFPPRLIAETIGIILGTLAWQPDILEKTLNLLKNESMNVRRNQIHINGSHAIGKISNYSSATAIDNFIYLDHQNSYLQSAINSLIKYETTYRGKLIQENSPTKITNISYGELSMLFEVYRLKATLSPHFSLISGLYIKASILAASFITRALKKNIEIRYKEIGNKLSVVFAFGSKISIGEFLKIMEIPIDLNQQLLDSEEFLQKEFSL